MADSFQVLPYSIESLKKIFSDFSETEFDLVSKKLHSIYFESYFSNEAINAKTIILENHYVDRDFLEDFAGYYVRCFYPYRHTCARLHFFNITFTDDHFKSLLSGVSSTLELKNFQDAYLGFIVIKPLPMTFIGRTCLKTYPPNGPRYFPCTRNYEANLFGIPLRVNDTLAFQEQDSVAAACATSALWSIFQGTGKLFQHHIPTPLEITKLATENSPIETRAIPNDKGLTTFQMAQAISKIGLEPYLLAPENDYILKSNLYAYLKGQIPLIMGINLIDNSVMTSPNSLGFHAVAMTGYNLGFETPIPYESTGFHLRSNRIDKIYGHDDQVGPFARMAFDGIMAKEFTINEIKESYSLSTSWRGDDGEITNVRAIPLILLMPLYHKIRIPFNLIHQLVFTFDRIISAMNLSFPSILEWEIYLTTVNGLKQSLSEMDCFKPEYRVNLLTENLPHFLWRATARCNDSILIDLIFDATDVKQGKLFIRSIEYDTAFSELLADLLCNVLTNTTLVDGLKVEPVWNIIKGLLKK